MGEFDFDKDFDRRGTGCRKWDAELMRRNFGVDENAIPMDIADMDFPCAPAICAAIDARAKLRDFSYTRATDDYFDAVIDWNRRRFGLSLSKDEIKPMFGTCGTLRFACQCFLQKGDAVLINVPQYRPFAEAVESAHCVLVENPLVLKDGRYFIDFDALERQIVEKNVKMYLLCSPQNPSGRVWTRDELDKICKICLKHGVILVSDEVHRDMIFSPNVFTTLWNANPAIEKQSLVAVSLNKGFNLGGLKSSYVLIRDPDLREKFLRYAENVYVTSPNVFVVPATVAAYNESEGYLDATRDYVAENFAFLYDWFEKNIPAAKPMKADSSFLAWVDFRDVFQSEAECVETFRKANLTMTKGTYFVAGGEGFARLNIGTQREKLKEALARLKAAILSATNRP